MNEGVPAMPQDGVTGHFDKPEKEEELLTTQPHSAAAGRNEHQHLENQRIKEPSRIVKPEKIERNAGMSPTPKISRDATRLQSPPARREVEQLKSQLQEVKNRWARATQKADNDANVMKQKHQEQIDKLEREWRARLDKETKMRLKSQKEATAFAGRLEMEKNVVEDLNRQLAKAKEELRLQARRQEKGRSDAGASGSAQTTPKVASGRLSLGHESNGRKATASAKQPSKPEGPGANHTDQFEECQRSCHQTLADLQGGLKTLRRLYEQEHDVQPQEIMDLVDTLEVHCATVSAGIKCLVAGKQALEARAAEQRRVASAALSQLNEMLKESSACYWQQRDHLMEIITGLEETVRMQEEALRRAQEGQGSAEEGSEAAEEEKAFNDDDGDVESVVSRCMTEPLVHEHEHEHEDEDMQEEGQPMQERPEPLEVDNHAAIPPPIVTSPQGHKTFQSRIKAPTPVSVRKVLEEVDWTPTRTPEAGEGTRDVGQENEAPPEGEKGNNKQGMGQSMSASKAQSQQYSNRHLRLNLSASKLG